MTTFKFAVRKFKKSAKAWMTDDDYPAMQALEKMAEELDKRMTPALLSQYGLMYRNLLSRKPQGEHEEDELEKALREADEGE